MDQRWIVAALVVIGFIITAGAIVLAYRGAKAQASDARRRFETGVQLYEEFTSASANTFHADTVAQELLRADYERRYAEVGADFPTWAIQPHLGAKAAADVMTSILDGARSNLIWAGVGLLVATGASVWSLWL